MVYHCSILCNCYFQVSFHLNVILYVDKITQNRVTELLLRGLLWKVALNTTLEQTSQIKATH